MIIFRVMYGMRRDEKRRENDAKQGAGLRAAKGG